MKKKLKIAITGGIGSGKTSVCELFAEKGYDIISADKIGKQLLHDPSVREEVIELLGEKSYFGETPNKKYIGSIVFNDENKLDKLNAIIHPHTIDRIEEEMDKSLEKNRLVFVESALIFEVKREEYFDYIILVTAPEEMRITRIVERENTTPEEVKSRMANQMSDEAKEKKADFVINNNSNLEDLQKKVEFIHTLLTVI